MTEREMGDVRDNARDLEDKHGDSDGLKVRERMSVKSVTTERREGRKRVAL